MARMSEGLLLGDIVERAALDRVTSRYVLRRGGELGLRESGGQGRHRRFDGAESVRLATCTRLVMHGTPLARAVAITHWAEEHWKQFAGVRPRPAVPFTSSVTAPWQFRLVNGRYVQLWHARRRTMKENYLGPTSDAFFDVVEHSWVTDSDVDDHLPELRWNMSMLAGVLTAESPPDSGEVVHVPRRGGKRVED